MRGSGAFRTSAAPGGALAGPWVRNPLWCNARAVPSLDLCFADTKSLVCGATGQNRITHTRASSATFVDSSGVLRSAVTNLKTFSDAILVANAYSANTSTLTTVTTPTPTASTTASLFTLNAGANTGNNTDGFNFGSGTTLTNSTQHTQSLFVKPAGATVLRLRSNVSGILFDFTLTGSGTAPSISSDLQGASIVLFPNGWYRVFWTFTTTTSAPGNRGDYWTIKTNVADGTNGLYVVGAQLEQASTVGDYVPTTSTINSAPRFDHNPTTGESLGLLVEEARTNFVLESEAFSTGWLIGAFTTSTAAVTSPSGQSSALSAKETSASNSQHLVAYLLNIPATTPYSFSVFVKPNGGNNISLRYYFADNNWIARIFSLTGTGSVTQSNAGASADVTNISASVVPYSNGWYRISLTLTQPSSRGAYFSIDGCTSSTPTLVSTSGIEVYTGDVNRGYYLWGAQLEAGAFATSYIPTTSATVTRAADVASITGSNFSSWYNQTEGTVFAEGNSYGFSASTFPTFAGISDGTANNRLQYAYITQASGGYLVASGGAFVVELYPNSAINPRRAAFAAAANNYAVSYNGASPTVDTAGNMPTGVNQMQIGNLLGAGATNNFFGTIKRLVYWGQRLPNTTLQQITQP